ncbi:hypothetical protein [Ferrovibrio terrae]|uniref:hypothetical protein n=1 Tax=Ferrovibrio terrae TaxID=2594003 RepID=UPI003137ABDB
MEKVKYDPFKDPNIAAARSGSAPDSPGDQTWRPRRYTPLELEERGLVEDYPRIPNAPAPGKRINWANAADNLARGHSVAVTASLCNCTPERIWRNLRRSRRFRARIDLAAERLRLEADLQFRNLNIQTVLQMRQRSGQLDTKTLHWLAEKLRLGQAPAQAETLADWLEAVAAVPGPKHGRRGRKATAAEAVPLGQLDPTGSDGLPSDRTGSTGTELACNRTALAANGPEPAPIRPGSLHRTPPASCG